MTIKPKKTLDTLAEALINDDLETIKKLVSDLDSLSALGIKGLNKLSGTNQFGEPYYLIAKRLGYDELSEYLHQHTSEDVHEEAVAHYTPAIALNIPEAYNAYEVNEWIYEHM